MVILLGLRFEDASHLSQVRRIREGLAAHLAGFGVPVEEVRLVNHGFNTTFRVRGPGLDAAVRVNVNSRRSVAAVRGELALVQFLGEAGVVAVPRPVPLFGGEALSALTVRGEERQLPVVAYGWVEGAIRPGSVAKWGRIGEAMGRIQAATRGWTVPEGCERPVLRDCLDGQTWRLGEAGAVFRECAERANAVIERLRAEAPAQVLHFDLHPWNVMERGGVVTVLDFDDSVWTHPAVDAAQSLYYLRRLGRAEEAERAFFSGLGGGPEALGVTAEEMEWLIGGRVVLLVNDILGAVTVELQREAAEYLEVSRGRLERLVATGRYEPRTV